jgi:hypothetical protein
MVIEDDPSGFEDFMAVSKEWFNGLHRSNWATRLFRQRRLKLVYCVGRTKQEAGGRMELVASFSHSCRAQYEALAKVYCEC